VDDLKAPGTTGSPPSRRGCARCRRGPVPALETIMAGIGKYRLTDALPKPKAGGKKGGKTAPPHQVVAEPTPEAHESKEARNNEASIRGRMVEIGRGNLQSGRHGQ